jgi:hypothetical protein
MYVLQQLNVAVVSNDCLCIMRLAVEFKAGSRSSIQPIPKIDS